MITNIKGMLLVLINGVSLILTFLPEPLGKFWFYKRTLASRAIKTGDS